MTIRKEQIETLIILVSFFLPVIVLVPWGELAQISDFMEYYAASQMMHSGAYNQVYNLAKIEHIQQMLVPNSAHSYIPFLISPIFAWALYPVACLPFKASLYIWTIGLTFLILALYLLLCRVCNLRGLQKCWVVVVMSAFGPCIESIRLGQLSPILLLGLVGLLITLKQKSSLKGNFLAAAAQSLLWLKPHLILPLILFELGAGLGIVSLWSILIAVSGAAISCALGGIDVLSSYWQTILSSQTQETIMGLMYGPIFRGQLLKLFGDLHLANQLSALVYGVVLIGSYLLGCSVLRHKISLNSLFTVIVPASLCFAPHLFNYDLLLLAPAIIMLISYRLSGRLSIYRFLILTLLAGLFILPSYVFLHYFYVCRGSLINPFFWGVLIAMIGSVYIERSLAHVTATRQELDN